MHFFKNTFRFATLILIISILLSQLSFAADQVNYGEKEALALNSLNLFLGTDKGFELENSLTREQSVTMVVRMMGKEDAALSKNREHPFTDLTPWAVKYIAYAYEAGITSGMSETEFGGGDVKCSDVMFITFVLRALGYSDTDSVNPDFTWNDPYELAEEIGIWTTGKIENFTRAETVIICWRALQTNLKGSEKILADKLISEGAFSRAQYNEALASFEN